MPHIPHQRQEENRAARSVDDMFTFMTILDENKALDMLPKYVASGLESMPSTRLYEGDFGVLLATIERMSGRLDTFGSALSANSRDRPFVLSQAQKRSAAKRQQQMSDIHADRQSGRQPERQPSQLNRQSDRQRKQVG